MRWCCGHCRCAMKKQSTNFIIRAFFIIVLTSVFIFFVLIYMARPVTRAESALTHFHIDLIQDMLSASMKGMSIKETQVYIEKLSDPIFDNARLLPLDKDAFQILTASTGIFLTDFELQSLHRGEALIAEMAWRGKHRKPEKEAPADAGPRKMDKFGRSKRLDNMRPPSVFDSKLLRQWLGFDPPPDSDLMPADPPPHPRSRNAANARADREETSGIQNNNGLKQSGHPTLAPYEATGEASFSPPPPPPMMPDKRKKNRVHYLIIPLESCQQLLYVRYEHPIEPVVPPSTMILGSIVIILIMLGGAFSLIYPTILRIQKYEQVCENVAKGDYASRCNDKRKDTLGLLANHIDEMTESIQSHLDRQKLLLQAVAHEMRTPLARVRFSLEMLDIPDDDEKRMARLKSIDEDLEEVDSLIKELNFFNYVDAGNGRQYFEENDVSEMIKVAVKTCSQTLSDFDFSIEGLEGTDLTLMVDAKSFRHVIINLLENAKRYAKKKIAIIVQKDENGQYLNISVEDDGPGIPVESRKLVLEPFASIDKSRNKARSGFGLGLAIVDRTLKLHGGFFRIEDSTLGGCRMLTQWPLDNAKK